MKFCMAKKLYGGLDYRFLREGHVVSPETSSSGFGLIIIFYLGFYVIIQYRYVKCPLDQFLMKQCWQKKKYHFPSLLLYYRIVSSYF